MRSKILSDEITKDLLITFAIILIVMFLIMPPLVKYRQDALKYAACPSCGRLVGGKTHVLRSNL